MTLSESSVQVLVYLFNEGFHSISEDMHLVYLRAMMQCLSYINPVILEEKFEPLMGALGKMKDVAILQEINRMFPPVSLDVVKSQLGSDRFPVCNRKLVQYMTSCINNNVDISLHQIVYNLV